MPYTDKQRRFIYAQASKGVKWAKKEVSSGAAEVLHKAKGKKRGKRHSQAKR